MKKRITHTSIKSLSLTKMNSRISRYFICFYTIILSLSGVTAQVPDWEYTGDYSLDMSVIFSIADECTLTNDPNDIVAAFDLNGEVRGVAQANVGNQAYVFIGGNTNGETIIFKVYDASLNQVFTAYENTISFVGGDRLGSVILNYDSQPNSSNGGNDQRLVDQTTATLDAVGTGRWSIIAGSGGVIESPQNPKSNFSGVLGTSYTLVWTLTDQNSCIGESDEVEIIFAIGEPEQGSSKCSDGLDNDGDGLVDCLDPDCAAPIFSDIVKTLPSPLDCSSSMSDGSFSFTAVHADQFSINEGNETQSQTEFSGLSTGVYTLWAKNAATDCITTEDVDLTIVLDPLEGKSIDLVGPQTLCKDLKDVSFVLNSNAPTGMMVDWAYGGAGATISNDDRYSLVSFTNDASSGYLKGSISSDCSTIEDSLMIEFNVVDFLCQSSQCPEISNVTSGLVQSQPSSQVYQAAIELISDADLPSKYYEFSAGEQIELNEGFSVKAGQVFLASIKNCNN